MENILYNEEIKKWRQGLDDSLRRENSWLALAGLFWLNEGKNSLGSNPTCDILLPSEAAPKYAGTITLNKRNIVLQASSDIGFEVNGELIVETILQPDTTDDPTMLHLGQLTLVAIQRGHQYGIRLWDNQRSERTNFPGRLWYPIKPDLQVWADYIAHVPPHPINLASTNGGNQSDSVVGSLAFEINESDCKLDVFQGPEGGFFVIFTDQTQTVDTYPGGRYLTTAKPEQGKVCLDFNRAYNPPCAFTPFATCPLAPPQNHLAAWIPAGERYQPSS